MNGDIRARSVILIDETGKNCGEVLLPAALNHARSQNLDLVEVDRRQDIPVCKVLDYGKMLYREAKNDKRQRKSSLVHKEIKLTPATGEGDYVVKVHKVEALLKKGHTVSITISLRGRLMHRPEAGHRLLDRMREDLEQSGKEQSRSQSGRGICANYTPKPANQQSGSSD